MGYGRNGWQTTSVTRWRQASATTPWWQGDSCTQRGLDHGVGHSISMTIPGNHQFDIELVVSFR